MSESQAVIVEGHDAVLVISLNRPAAKNAIDQATTDALAAALQRLDEDPDLRVGLLRGEGGFFCAGLDLKAFAKHGMPSGLGRLLKTGSPRKPVVAVVHGAALAGGLELALLADVIVAADDARFGLPEARRGLVAAGGGLIRLPTKVPLGSALEMALTGEPISAQRAYEIGLVTRLATAADADREGMDLARAMAKCAPLSVIASRSVIRTTVENPSCDPWERQRDQVGPVLKSRDAREGAIAFAEKREPQWSGT